MSPSIESTDNFVGVTFKNLDYRSATIADKEFEGCSFQNCKFAQTAWDGCRFRDCTFTNCGLYLATVKNCVFNAVSFEKCEAVYINWTAAAWTKAGLLRLVHFENSDVSHSTFIGLLLPKMRLIKSKAIDVEFSEAKLAGGDFHETDFADSRFLNCDLTGANFTNAVNYAISPLVNKVKGATFSLPQALSLLAALEIKLAD